MRFRRHQLILRCARRPHMRSALVCVGLVVLAAIASTARADGGTGRAPQLLVGTDATSGTSSASVTFALGADATNESAGDSSGSGSGIRAFMPGKLRDAALARPDSRFNVIVQGRHGDSSRDVETEVDGEAAATTGTSEGSKRKFRTLAAVSAELTGRELLKLAQRDDILAITRDDRVATSSVALPTVSGNERAGSRLKAETAGWPNDGTNSYTYQWQRCDPSGVRCADIGGATGDTYRAGSVDIGSTLQVALSAVSPDGTTAAATSPTTGLIAPVTG